LNYLKEKCLNASVLPTTLKIISGLNPKSFIAITLILFGGIELANNKNKKASADWGSRWSR